MKTENKIKPVKYIYKCNVLNCGKGKCVHKQQDTHCPLCGYPMVLVVTSGHMFCSNPNHDLCDYGYDTIV